MTYTVGALLVADSFDRADNPAIGSTDGGSLGSLAWQADGGASTPVTVDASELTSYTAAVPSVVNGANADIAVGDMWRVDIDTAGTGAKGLQLIGVAT